MRIAGKNKWEILLKYYPPWQGYPPKKRRERKTTEVIEVFEMLGDPRKLRDIPEDVRAILKFIRLESFLQEA
ncbi:hypothetical protein [Thermococcus radiotolerans]|uniref:Uncharacterized protein n=1 Tax=Thermococcus radiotolerans TaxID=187880 RepID=A0A2Z2N0P6_9EURY|nr:hypothetical protein [Thermococcus radiotolerans]ASJ14030.1 hypothetical protein A3L10_02365 [Thermococcus radiotolerans]